jgi:hypothetical protein
MEINLKELHLLARGMKWANFENWFAEKYMNIPSTAVKPDIYLTISEHPDMRKICRNCKYNGGKPNCLNCDNDFSNYKPIEHPVEVEKKETIAEVNKRIKRIIELGLQESAKSKEILSECFLGVIDFNEEAAMAAMQEQAIGFAEWVEASGYIQLDRDKKWVACTERHLDNPTLITTAQLYELYNKEL